MASSLQDQLLKAGLIDKNKVKQVRREKYKQAKQQPKGQPLEDETRLRAQQALAQKAAQDRELNLRREQAAAQKAIAAQIKQLIENHRIDRNRGEVAYQFADGAKIKQLYVTAAQQDALAWGQVAIVRLGAAYELVPKVVAGKIRQRDAAVVVSLAAPRDSAAEEEDPYADYQIPDDLMW
jgi:uncharacterized protein YaiL (DUF2058 family)